jgi:branched-chain amino acid transport system permease protein
MAELRVLLPGAPDRSAGIVTSILPFVVIGLFSGAVYALAAMGLVLTYRTSGVFNFAYGAVSMFCAFTFSQLRDTWHISQWFSLPLVLGVLGPALGLAFERLFRPLDGQPAEIQIVVALGALAFLQALAPILYGGQARGLRSIFPTSTFRLGSRLHVGWDELATLLLAATLAGGLYWILRRTRFGVAARAVVDNRDLCAMSGVAPASVSRIAWVISSVFAALVGILLSPQVGLDVYVLVLLVIYAFAPAVLARLFSLPIAFAGAIALGVAQSVLARYNTVGTVADFEASIPYLALFAVLLAYGGKLRQAGSSVRPLRATIFRHAPRTSLATTSVLVAGAMVLPHFLSAPQLGDAAAGMVFAAIGLTLVVLTGWAGQISLAQFSFVGIGAFSAAHLAGSNGVHFFPAALLGAAIAVPAGVVVGLPSLRLSGLYLALATMAFALLMDNLVFDRTSITGGYTGMVVPRPAIGPFHFSSPEAFYYLTAIVLGAYSAAAAVLRRGPVGRRLQMLNDSPVAAGTLGVNLTVTKLAVFAGCGAAAAFAGALFGAGRLTIAPGDVSFNASLELLLLVVLGGRSLIGGALLAGAVYTIELLPIPSTANQYISLGVAAGVIAIANNPDGPLAVAGKFGGYLAALFRPLPARDARHARA